MGKRLIAMQCGERSLGHLALVFGLLAVGTLSLSVATDYWLFTTEALDMEKLLSESSSPLPPPPPEPEPPEPPPTVDVAHLSPDFDVDEPNATEDATEIGSDANYLLPDGYPIIVAKLHSGLWRTCIYYEFNGNNPVVVNLQRLYM